MSDQPIHVSLDLTPLEQEAVDLLQEEMHLKDTPDVMHVLLRQAHQRIAVVCPTCGHSAKKSSEDEARCIECMSGLQLSEGIWKIIQAP